MSDASDDGVIGAFGSASYEVPALVVAEATTDARRETWWDRVQRFVVVSEDGDRACFLTRACDRYEQTVEDETQVPLLGTASRRFTNQLRWITTDAGEGMLVVRQLAPTPVQLTSTLMAIDQQYSLALVADEGDGALRAEAIWVDARLLGVELPEGFAVRQAVGQMQAAADVIGEAFGG